MMQLVHLGTFGGRGNQPAEFQRSLTSIAVDTEGRLLAVGDEEVKRFSPAGELEHRFPTRGRGWSIAVDADSLWIGMRGQIDHFSPDGDLLGTLDDKQRLGRVTGLAIHGETLLVADATHRTIHLYENGQWQREVGQDVNTRGFMLPNGVLDVALDTPSASLLVAHPQKHRVERYDLAGELTEKFGRFGMHDPADFGGCCNPTNIAALPDGLLAVSEKAPPRVKVYSADGTFVAQSPDGVFDENTKNIDLAADRRGKLYATDPLRCTIEVFELQAESN